MHIPDKLSYNNFENSKTNSIADSLSCICLLAKNLGGGGGGGGGSFATLDETLNPFQPSLSYAYDDVWVWTYQCQPAAVKPSLNWTSCMTKYRSMCQMGP